MRKSFLLLSIISLFSFLTISCRKEDSFCMQENIVINDLEEEYPELLDFLQEDENSRTVLPKDSNYIEHGYYVFFYNNKKYECNYSISKDSTVVFDNPEVKVLFDKLKNKRPDGQNLEDIIPFGLCLNENWSDISRRFPVFFC